jgi:hypothetical protein
MLKVKSINLSTLVCVSTTKMFGMRNLLFSLRKIEAKLARKVSSNLICFLFRIFAISYFANQQKDEKTATLFPQQNWNSVFKVLKGTFGP